MKRIAGNAEPQLGTGDVSAELEPGAPGWYSRGYLPHFDMPGTLQFITFRLADSLPQIVLSELEQELKQQPATTRERERRKRVEQWLDAGLGCCALQHPLMAEVMQETLRKFDGERYRLIAWCIMPNHVHALIETLSPLAKIMQSWKSYTGRWALSHYAELGLGVPSKQFWMREYWDRYIRDEEHFHSVVAYIHDNPVKAGMCKNAREWRWSSASADGLA
jgi:putative transposase